MKLLLDTSVLIDHLRDDRRAIEFLGDANDDAHELWGSVVTRTELIRGMRSNEFARTTRLLETISWMDVTIDIADRAGELARRYRRSHPGIDLADFTIAASTEQLNGRLITRNVKHFPMFPGIDPPY